MQTIPLDPLYPRAWYAHLFQVFNALSFTIVLGTPLILFLKDLGAPATVLGLAAAMAPLFTVLQIPAAGVADRTGYRSFVLRGWASRSFFILGLAALALFPDALPRGVQIGVAIALLAAFSVARGIASCGFLPWTTLLVPERLRGRFLSREQTAISLASLASTLGAALYLRHQQGSRAFAVLFAASFAFAIVSLFFLRRIPDAPAPELNRRRGRVPWKAMLLHPPFFRLLLYTGLMNVVYAGSGVFWVPLLRDRFHATDAFMLQFPALHSAVVVMTMWVFGRLSDRTGSRPLLALAGASHVAHYVVWAAVAGRAVPLCPASVVGIVATSAVGSALFNLSSTRLLMSIVPEMGRSHFFALFSVINSLVLGTLPIAWGAAVDLTDGLQVRIGPFEWNSYSALYVFLCLMTLAFQALRRRVPDPKGMTTEAFFQELLVKTPARALSRFVMRRLTPW